ncbi:hypothetical protein SAMN05660235_01784 [Sporolituus thermophilus DSM 23256]|uniref:Uncharacterized protein n=1 Tax=Sporolituus thermophilus DSM 23256 TaxID=1123285 RepID=A0A1G7LI31_9FIRM|nr:hypothetical protein SAMN05660235_01784 [Sporolituus thermophilus DSM 23256]
MPCHDDPQVSEHTTPEKQLRLLSSQGYTDPWIKRIKHCYHSVKTFIKSLLEDFLKYAKDVDLS